MVITAIIRSRGAHDWTKSGTEARCLHSRPAPGRWYKQGWGKGPVLISLRFVRSLGCLAVKHPTPVTPSASGSTDNQISINATQQIHKACAVGEGVEFVALGNPQDPLGEARSGGCRNAEKTRWFLAPKRSRYQAAGGKDRVPFCRFQVE